MIERQGKLTFLFEKMFSWYFKTNMYFFPVCKQTKHENVLLRFFLRNSSILHIKSKCIQFCIYPYIIFQLIFAKKKKKFLHILKSLRFLSMYVASCYFRYLFCKICWFGTSKHEDFNMDALWFILSDRLCLKSLKLKW